MFDIHCDVVKKALFAQAGQRVGKVAVRIELDFVAERAYFFDKIFQIRFKRRLAAGDTDAVQNFSAFF